VYPKGSEELVADRDPEEARRILDPVLERMMEAVHRYVGTINQIMGDAILALFGAPLAHEDHALRACYAALRMQEAVEGKARLVWEFSHSHRTRGRLVLESGPAPYGKATAYLPVIDLLKSYCGIEARDALRRMRQQLLGKVLDLDRTLEPLLPPLLGLLDVSGDDAASQARDPAQRRQHTLEALKPLLLRESQQQPLLLVCEDLHWIDAVTQALLDNLWRACPQPACCCW
jgi:predicted ATPase